MLKKRYRALIESMLLGASTAYAFPMTCTCTTGDMQMVISGDNISMSCTNGGKVTCTIS